MATNDSLKDRRKYQRVLVEPSSKILTVTVVGYGPTLVFDMSYEGAAFAQPKQKKISSVDETMSLHLKTEVDEATIPARAVRVNDEVVAVQFASIDVNARIIIDRVVTDRIIGFNMSLIDPKHYGVQSDFSLWFHGPKDTNLYLWQQGGKLLKAHMEMANAAMIFEDDMILFENKKTMEEVPLINNQQIGLKVLAITQQIENDSALLAQFLELVKNHVKS